MGRRCGRLGAKLDGPCGRRIQDCEPDNTVSLSGCAYSVYSGAVQKTAADTGVAAPGVAAPGVAAPKQPEEPPTTVFGQELEVGTTVVLQNIFFDFDKASLLQQSYNELQHLLDLLQRYPKMRVEVSGHTDSHGSVDYNLRLSHSRAKAVVDYLISKGIDSKRLQYKGYGKSKPIDTNTTEEGRARNRRVELKILSL